MCALEHMHVCICAHTIICLWRSEDSCGVGSLLSLYMGPRALTLVVRLGGGPEERDFEQVFLFHFHVSITSK